MVIPRRRFRSNAAALVPAPSTFNTSSLLFTAASSQYLTATGKTGASAQKLTIATWLKSSSANGSGFLYSPNDGSSSNRIAVGLNAGSLLFENLTGGSVTQELFTNATIADTNWHHVLWAVDTTLATAADRVKAYLDGTRLTSMAIETDPAQNANLSTNFAATYGLGSKEPGPGGGLGYFDGKLAQFYYIDGQALTPTSFITGTPGTAKAFSGAYSGVFDFYLPFSNPASTATLGADASGESNNWTLVNMTTGNYSTDHP